jgi:hypothetical protein
MTPEMGRPPADFNPIHAAIEHRSNFYATSQDHRPVNTRITEISSAMKNG